MLRGATSTSWHYLDLALDIPNRGIGGTAKYTLERLGDGDFVLDQVALDIESVSVDGEAALHEPPETN